MQGLGLYGSKQQDIMVLAPRISNLALCGPKTFAFRVGLSGPGRWALEELVGVCISQLFKGQYLGWEEMFWDEALGPKSQLFQFLCGSGLS